MRAMWMRRVLVAAALLALAPACGDSDSEGAKVSESPNLGDSAKKMVSAAAGGELALDEAGVSLSVPPGALAEDTELTAEVVSKTGLPEAANLAGNVIEFGPDGLEFLKPVALEIDLAGATIPEGADVSIAWLDEKKNEWVDLSGSKVAGDKVTAETTHFTKFVIRFVIDAAGNVTQDAGMCDASKFKACGGDVEGTWEFSAACITLPTMTDGQGSGASCVAIEAAVDFSGEVTFAGGKISGESKSEFEVKQTISKQCFADQITAMSMGQGTVTPDQIDCSEFDDTDDEDNVVTAAEDKGDTCVLSPAPEMDTDPIDGTYVVKGNTLTITDSEVDEGETEEPEAQEYCISGDTLTLLGTDSENGAQFMIIAKRK